MKLIPRILSILICSSIMLCGCSDKGKSETNITGNNDPAPISDGERNVHNFLNIEEETNYDNIIVETTESTYKTSDDTVTCMITNKNPGKGFYYYEVPFIEKNINGEWVRLLNTTNRLDVAVWLFCGIEGNKNESNSCNIKTSFSDYEPKIDEGNYRLVVFTAEKPLYAEFNVVE